MAGGVVIDSGAVGRRFGLVSFLLQSRPHPSIQKVRERSSADLDKLRRGGEQCTNRKNGEGGGEDFKAFAPFLFIMIPADDDDGGRCRAPLSPRKTRISVISASQSECDAQKGKRGRTGIICGMQQRPRERKQGRRGSFRSVPFSGGIVTRPSV